MCGDKYVHIHTHIYTQRKQCAVLPLGHKSGRKEDFDIYLYILSLGLVKKKKKSPVALLSLSKK